MIRNLAARFRSRAFLLIAAGGAIGVIASAAWASIPDSSGTIHACYAPDGALRVIDTDAGQQCKKNEKALDWSRAPVAELPDAFVVTRAGDPLIPASGGTFIELAVLRLPAGSYQVWGKVGLANRSSDVSFRVQCALIPSSPDGTPRPAGDPSADAGSLHLSPALSSGEEGVIGLSVSQVLPAPGHVRIACAGNGNTSGATASHVSIRAVEVGSVTETVYEPPPLP